MTYDTDQNSEFKLGWFTLNNNRKPDFKAANDYLQEFTLSDFQHLDSPALSELKDFNEEEFQIFKKTLIKDLAEVELLLKTDSVASALAKVDLWGSTVYVAEGDLELVESLTGLHVIGAMVAAGFEDEI